MQSVDIRNQITWNSMSRAWQVAFEQGWEAFKQGSIPIGASIADKDGNVISSGRNRINENCGIYSKVAHAESEAIQKLDIVKHPDVREYTLHACMEPCFMCVGAILMGNLRKVRVVAMDSYCGAINYVFEDKYIASKNIKVDFELGTLEMVQLVMQTYYELKTSNGEHNHITNLYREYNPDAVQIADLLYTGGRLGQRVADETPFSEVFDEIAMLTKG